VLQDPAAPPVAPAPHHPERKPPTPDPPPLPAPVPTALAVQAPTAKAHAPAMAAAWGPATAAQADPAGIAATPQAPTARPDVRAAMAMVQATTGAAGAPTTVGAPGVTTAAAAPGPTTDVEPRAVTTAAAAPGPTTGAAARPRQPAARWPRPSAGPAFSTSQAPPSPSPAPPSPIAETTAPDRPPSIGEHTTQPSPDRMNVTFRRRYPPHHVITARSVPQAATIASLSLFCVVLTAEIRDKDGRRVPRTIVRPAGAVELGLWRISRISGG
jgi:hypothetical protein